MIKLVDVYTQHPDGTLVAIAFLYDLLAERDPIANISHREMPTFEKHRNFVDSRPYKAWYIIYADHGPIGATYMTNDNEIGIAILKAYQGKGYGKAAVCMLMNRHPGEQFLANINPHNSRSIDVFEGLGFELKQLTFVKEPKEVTDESWAEDNLPNPKTLEQAIRERNKWVDTAQQHYRNEDYYRNLVIKIGEMLGPEAYVSNDGSVQQDILCAKVPELVAKRLSIRA